MSVTYQHELPVAIANQERRRIAALQTDQRARYPFASIVGMSEPKRALLLLAVDPRLKGALIEGAPGSAKSLLARSFHSLIASDDPSSSPPFVELPLNATEDHLLSGIDLEATLASGSRRAFRGALARADGGVLYVDDVNLLDAGSSDHIAAALEEGFVRLERDGISETLSSRFCFIGTGDPFEGETSANLRDRIGLLVEVGSEDSAAAGALIIERALTFEKDSTAFVEFWAVETAAIIAQIEEARERLDSISVRREDIARIAQIAMTLGVEGNRADIFAVRAARANAALAGREFIADEDLVAAIKLVLLPRATSLPEQAQPDNGTSAAERDDQPREPDGGQSEGVQPDDAGSHKPIGDLLIEAIDSQAPGEALALEQRRKPDRLRAASGRRARTVSSSRGRYSGVVNGRGVSSRIAVDATLRAAAPHQLARRSKRALSASNDLDRSSDAVAGGRLKIKPDDLRFKRYKQRSGALFIFAVDASGSMAVNRMAQAKGAIVRLLGEAYLHRDKVALVSFRGAQADVLLAPTRSVELARRLVDAIPTGGATPIAAGLIKALELARLARLQGLRRSVVLLMTDGRANVGFISDKERRSSNLDDELRDIGLLLRLEGLELLVVDTKPKFLSRGEGSTLANTLGARYLYLPKSDSRTFDEAVGTVLGKRWLDGS